MKNRHTTSAASLTVSQSNWSVAMHNRRVSSLKKLVASPPSVQALPQLISPKKQLLKIPAYLRPPASHKPKNKIVLPSNLPHGHIFLLTKQIHPKQRRVSSPPQKQQQHQQQLSGAV